MILEVPPWDVVMLYIREDPMYRYRACDRVGNDLVCPVLSPSVYNHGRGFTISYCRCRVTTVSRYEWTSGDALELLNAVEVRL